MSQCLNISYRQRLKLFLVSHFLTIVMPSGALLERSELHADGSVLDGWDKQSLRSYRSRMAKPIADA
jgi:hypothetical protein